MSIKSYKHGYNIFVMRFSCSFFPVSCMAKELNLEKVHVNFLFFFCPVCIDYVAVCSYVYLVSINLMLLQKLILSYINFSLFSANVYVRVGGNTETHYMNVSTSI